MLVKLTPEENLINILQTAFAWIFFCQRIKKPSCNKRKAAQSTFLPKRRFLKMLI